MATLASPLGAAPQEDCPIAQLSCPAAAKGLDQALCLGVRQALIESLPDYVVRQVDDLSQTPERPHDIAVSLQVLEHGETSILARLDWCHGPCSILRQGNPLRLSVMDAQLSSEMLQRFAYTLLQATPQLLAAPTKIKRCFNK